MLIVSVALLHGEERIRCSVTYISSSVIYLDAGRVAGFAEGDTADVFRNGISVAALRISAVSSKTSSAQALASSMRVLVGDSVIGRHAISVSSPDTAVVSSAVPARTGMPPPRRERRVFDTGSDENVVTGRVAVQYIGVTADDPRFAVHQPAPMVRLQVRNLYGTGMVFSIYERMTYDLTDYYRRYGNASRLTNRLYECSLQYDDPGSALGYGLGRMTSRYVSSLGMFDGGHLFVRSGPVTGGVMAGTDIAVRSMGFDKDRTKSALFVNYRNRSGFEEWYDGTVAYVRQMVKGKLDREFVYLQSSIMLGTAWSMFGSSELELNDIANGVRSHRLKMSNAYLSLSYDPVTWLTTTVGYDGTRSIYLFETMRTFSDTLLDRDLMQGFRGLVTIRLPFAVDLSGGMTYRTKNGYARDARNLNASLRTYSFLGSDLSLSARYSNILGTFSDGNDVTLSADYILSESFTAGLRYDYYEYTIRSIHQMNISRTFGGSLNYRISRLFYASATADDVRDAALHSLRMFGEIGVRF